MNAGLAARLREEGKRTVESLAATGPGTRLTYTMQALESKITLDFKRFTVASEGDGPLAWSELLQGALEADLGPGDDGRQRRAQGAFFTPPPIVEGVLDLALQPVIDAALTSGNPASTLGNLRVLDPACGAGAFLLAAARRLHAAWCALGHLDAWQRALRQVVGMDVDPVACAVTAAALRWQAGDGALAVDVEARDFLLDPRPWQASVVVGNPPFLAQLKRETARDEANRRSIKAAFGALTGAYTDTAALFLAKAVREVALGGTVALVEPMSLLAARDAGPVREFLLQQAALQAMWLGPGTMFSGARVDVCAPVLRREAPREAGVRVVKGLHFEPVGDAPMPAARETWSPMLALALAVPTVVVQRAGTVADLANVTADFRDQFYGLQPFVREQVDAHDPGAPLILTGHIEPLRCDWGQVPVRFGKKPWQRPVIDVAALTAADPGLGRWAAGRLQPKLVLATQSRVIECAVDDVGHWLNTTPTIAVMAAPDVLDLLAAGLSCGAMTMLAWQTCCGTGMAAAALKLSARQVAALPLPTDRQLWERAAAQVRLARAMQGAAHRMALLEASALASQAYGVNDLRTIEAAWQQRLQRR